MGLNDMRAGMAAEDFRQDMEQIIIDVRQACSPVTVVTTVYHMTAYDLYPPYDQGSIAASERGIGPGADRSRPYHDKTTETPGLWWVLRTYLIRTALIYCFLVVGQYTCILKKSL